MSDVELSPGATQQRGWCSYPCKLFPGERCAVPLTRWHWDGNVDAPTLTPSIRCLVKADADYGVAKACGLHIEITKGVIKHV